MFFSRLCAASVSLRSQLSKSQLYNPWLINSSLERTASGFHFLNIQDLPTWLQKNHGAYCPVPILHADNGKTCFFPQVCNDILIFFRGYFKRITTISFQFTFPVSKMFDHSQWVEKGSLQADNSTCTCFKGCILGQISKRHKTIMLTK